MCGESCAPAPASPTSPDVLSHALKRIRARPLKTRDGKKKGPTTGCRLAGLVRSKNLDLGLPAFPPECGEERLVLSLWDASRSAADANFLALSRIRAGVGPEFRRANVSGSSRSEQQRVNEALYDWDWDDEDDDEYAGKAALIASEYHLRQAARRGNDELAVVIISQDYWDGAHLLLILNTPGAPVSVRMCVRTDARVRVSIRVRCCIRR